MYNELVTRKRCFNKKLIEAVFFSYLSDRLSLSSFFHKLLLIIAKKLKILFCVHSLYRNKGNISGNSFVFDFCNIKYTFHIR